MAERGQAVFFDGILFLLVVIFSVSLVFISLNAYTTAQDRAINSAYFMNYMQSVSKSLYYVDARTLGWEGPMPGTFGGGGKVLDYCHDLGYQPATGSWSDYYCEASDADFYPLGCSKLKDYPPLITVMDLLKKDISDPPTVPSAVYATLNDSFGGSKQLGKTALRCAMKEVMKPFTFSGYHYLAEVTHTTGSSGIEQPILPSHEGSLDKKFASDVMYTDFFKRLPTPNPPAVVIDEQANFDCGKTGSRQLVAIRSPFMILVGKGGGGELHGVSSSGFEQVNLAFRVCAWPSNETLG